MTPASPPKPEPTVVGIGASAGGLAALRTFMTHVPADSGLAFVVVVHLSPNHESHLAELLQPNLQFPVQQVTDTTPLEANHVYVIPPNSNLSAIDTHLRLTKLEARRQERAPIDHFFRTLASTHDGHSIAVILTGTGSDGTLGVKEVKANGGLVIVQDPNEAEFDGMPQSAIATGLIDFILPVAEIPAAILRFSRTQPRIPFSKDGEEPPQDETLLLHKVFAQLRARTDRDFSRYKRSTVLRRIGRRMQLNFLEDLSAYLEKLREMPEEVRALADDLLITVTDFFRDPEVFERLQNVEIPRLFRSKDIQESVRVWSVGCATGEEVYSLAMLLIEEAGQHEMPPQIQLFGSDLHSRSLEKAREGFYPGDIEADVSAERLKRFFHKESGGYRIRKEVRDLVVFAPHNLLGDPPFSRLDLISCRNLLIYLERDVQRDVIDLFHYALNPEGTLLLGSAETLEATDLFRVEDKKLCLFRKRNVPPREPRLPVFPLTRKTLMADGGGKTGATHDPVANGSLHQQLVEEYAPPSILVSPDGKIVHFSQQAGHYLVHPGGEPTTDVMKLVRPELRIELQASLQSALEKKQPVDSKPVPVQLNGQTCPVTMRLRPSLNPSREGFVLVIFDEREPTTAEWQDHDGSPQESENQRIQELESDLNVAHQRLQAIIEEYEASREEMKASSEEMQSTNEELRSTMEELETSKEELQSINEELHTVNQQNRHKVEELAQLTSDLQNLMAATDIATLFLDRDLRILRFTPKLGDLFNVRIADRGRPISDLTHRLGYGELKADAEAVLSRLMPIEREIQDDRGRWYLTRILPYRSSEDRIQGVVITFIDIHTRKETEAKLRESEERFRKMVDVDVIGVLVTDATGTLTDCNDTFLHMSGYGRDEVTSRKVTWRLLTPPESLEAGDLQLRKLVTTGQIGPYEKEILRKDGSRCWMLFAGASLGNATLIEYCFDISDRRLAQELARTAGRNLEFANEALTVANTDLKHFSYAVSHDMQEPLRAVTTYTQLLAREYKDKLDPKANEYIQHAVNGARQMDTLLKDLREYWAVDGFKHETRDCAELDAIVERVVTQLKFLIDQSGATISRDSLPSISGELYPLTILFQNLIGNAIKYRKSNAPPHIHISARRNGDEWIFSVSDNGIGIKTEYLELIFAPFKRLWGKEIPGTGLGLAICEKIVKRYRGRIWVESTEGEGSTFQFTLPLLDVDD